MTASEASLPATMAALRSQLARSTSPGIERAVGVLLGAEDDAAASAVRVLVDAGRLGDGLALPALLLAARRGTDAAQGVRELAGGRPLPEGWSAYELRAAAEEAAEDLRAGFEGPRDEAGPIRCTGPDAPLVAARAVRAGAGGSLLVGAAAAHLADGLSLRRAMVDVRWIVRLAGVAGWKIGQREEVPGGAALQARLAEGGGALPERAAAGLDEVVPVTADRLDLLT